METQLFVPYTLYTLYFNNCDFIQGLFGSPGLPGLIGNEGPKVKKQLYPGVSIITISPQLLMPRLLRGLVLGFYPGLCRGSRPQRKHSVPVHQ